MTEAGENEFKGSDVKEKRSFGAMNVLLAALLGFIVTVTSDELGASP
jgi:hypothetical protein